MLGDRKLETRVDQIYVKVDKLECSLDSIEVGIKDVHSRLCKVEGRVGEIKDKMRKPPPFHYVGDERREPAWCAFMSMDDYNTVIDGIHQSQGQLAALRKSLREDGWDSQKAREEIEKVRLAIDCKLDKARFLAKKNSPEKAGK